MSEIKHTSQCPTQPGGDPGGINRNYHCNCCFTERKRIKELEAKVEEMIAVSYVDGYYEDQDDAWYRDHDPQGRTLLTATVFRPLFEYLKADKPIPPKLKSKPEKNHDKCNWYCGEGCPAEPY